METGALTKHLSLFRRLSAVVADPGHRPRRAPFRLARRQAHLLLQLRDAAPLELHQLVQQRRLILNRFEARLEQDDIEIRRVGVHG